MPEGIINDEVLTIEPGERLLDVARRHAVHIGFVCDGHGLCQMCECTVERGMEHLSPTTEAEETWLTTQQMEHGHRLACQASLRGPGPVKLQTRAEELRRQATLVMKPTGETSRQEEWSRLVDHLMIMSVEHIKRFPHNMMYTMVECFSLRPTLRSAGQMFNDSWRVLWRAATGKHLDAPPLGNSSLASPSLPDSGSGSQSDTPSWSPAVDDTPTQEASPSASNDQPSRGFRRRGRQA